MEAAAGSTPKWMCAGAAAIKTTSLSPRSTVYEGETADPFLGSRWGTLPAMAVLGWVLCWMWVGVAVWVFFDARRRGRTAVWHAVATGLLPGVGLAVYMGTREAGRRDDDDRLSPSGHLLLRELTSEVERLRAELDAVRGTPGSATAG